MKRALAIAVLLLAPSCGALLDIPANLCESDGDCRTGVCDVERGMCVTAPATTLQVGIEVLPASDPLGGAPLAVTFPAFPVDETSLDGAVRELALPSGVESHGLVHWNAEPVSAQITFTLASAFPGGPPARVETQTAPTPIEYAGGLSNYAVQLLPSQRYDISVVPNGEWAARLPPLRAASAFQTTLPGTRNPADIAYPETLPEVQGVLVDSAGAEQPGMIVRAIDAVTGAVISSTYTTGSDTEQTAGYFMLRLAPGVESWLFSINASTERITAGSLTPTFTVDPGTLIEDAEGRVTLLVPPVSEEVIVFHGTVEAEVGRGAAATVSFTSSDIVDDATGVIGTFRAMAATDETGVFQVQLLPGTYDIVVTPSDPDRGVLHEVGRRIDPGVSELRGAIFSVPARVQFNGMAMTSDGLGMVDALVRGQARGSRFGDTLPAVSIFARSTETQTDLNGRYRLPLDVGLYDVFLEPPAGSNWPWALARDVPNGGSGATFSIDLVVGAPVPLNGRIVYGELDRRPAENASVRAYAIVEEPEGGTRAVLIGRATTGPDGTFTVLLPASL
jgi:hypothetical protein